MTPALELESPCSGNCETRFIVKLQKELEVTMPSNDVPFSCRSLDTGVWTVHH